MKICSYGINTMEGKGPVKKRKRRMDNTNTPTTTAKIGDQQQQIVGDGLKMGNGKRCSTPNLALKNP
jgi:hypothetical protein